MGTVNWEEVAWSSVHSIRYVVSMVSAMGEVTNHSVHRSIEAKCGVMVKGTGLVQFRVHSAMF